MDNICAVEIYRWYEFRQLSGWNNHWMEFYLPPMVSLKMPSNDNNNTEYSIKMPVHNSVSFRRCITHYCNKVFLCKKNDLIESKSTSWKTNFKVLVVDHKMLLRILAMRTMLLLVQLLGHDFFANGIIY